MIIPGTPVVGNTDDLKPLQDICKKENIWMHLEGFVLYQSFVRHNLIHSNNVP